MIVIYFLRGLHLTNALSFTLRFFLFTAFYMNVQSKKPEKGLPK